MFAINVLNFRGSSTRPAGHGSSNRGHGPPPNHLPAQRINGSLWQGCWQGQIQASHIQMQSTVKLLHL